MKRFLFLGFLLFGYALASTDEPVLLTTSVEATLYVLDLEKTETIVSEFLNQHAITPQEYKRSHETLFLIFTLNSNQYANMSKLFDDWGFIAENNTRTINYVEQINDIEHETTLTKKEQAEYQVVLDQLAQGSDRYHRYWEMIQSLESQINKLETEKGKLLREHERFRIELNFQEERNTVNTNNFPWVNMPGLEYSFLSVEQPVIGVSAEKMPGYLLKYMFTKGKTYAQFGLYKSDEAFQDSTIDEIYIFGMGQDFYSKHLGRGKRTYFNLYTSLNTGVYVATNDIDITTSWYFNPFIGLELFKNNYFIVDNKVGYFLPFKNNRTQRGLLYNASFNFVF